MTTLSTVVVNYRGLRLLEPCLRSVREAVAQLPSPAETVVVDNASDDGSCELIRSEFPEVALVELPENRGFAAAVNEGVRRTRGEWILLLNNDARLATNALRELSTVADTARPDVGSIAAQLRFADGSERINSAGIEVDRLGVAVDRLLGQPADAGESEPLEVFGASAGAALYRRAMLDQLEGFDECFFLYLEDVDVAWRARMHGWRCLYVPGAVAWHVHSGTAVHGSRFKHRLVGRNRLRLLAKNADERHLRRHWPAIVGYELGYVLYASVADRTLAPVLGRLQGLREWPSLRRAYASERRPVPLARRRGVRAALHRRAVWLSAHRRSEPGRAPN